MSLCLTCRRALRVETRRGTAYLKCSLSESDPSYPKYPPQPVTACAGYDPAEPDGGRAGAPGKRTGDTGP